MDADEALQTLVAALANPLTGATVDIDADGAVQSLLDELRAAAAGVDMSAVGTSLAEATRQLFAMEAALDADVGFDVGAEKLALFGDGALRATESLGMLAENVDALAALMVPGGMLAEAALAPIAFDASAGIPIAPPLGTGEGSMGAPGSTTVTIHNLTVVSNDADDMLKQIEDRARQKSRLGGVTGLDLAVRPVGTRGTPSGVR